MKYLKKYNQLNEGLRDKMLPKPWDEFSKSMDELFIDLKVNYQDNQIGNFTMFNLDNLYLIEDWDDFYKLFFDYFNSLIKPNSKKVFNNIDEFKFEYYPELKFMFYNAIFDYGLYFDGSHIDKIKKYIYYNY